MSNRTIDVIEREVYKFADFAAISNSKPSEKVEIGLPENLADTNIFRNLFCNHPFRQGTKSSQVPIYFDLDLIQQAWEKTEFDKNGNPDFESLKNGEYEKYIPALKNIAEVCMPYLSVKENPNKFLKLALDYRDKNMVNVKSNNFVDDITQQPINSPTHTLYIGLDRIAQFLNFCVLINSLLKKNGPLMFEKEVLKKLLDQVEAARKDLGNLIQDYGDKALDDYKKELEEYRKKYDSYVAQNQSQNIFDVLTFVEWMDNGIRKTDGTNYSGLENTSDGKDKLDILLHLDSILQCEAAIDNFINSKALEPSILNWFKDVWCSIKLAWNFLANKMNLSQRWHCNIRNMQFKSNTIIPKLDFTRAKETNVNLN